MKTILLSVISTVLLSVQLLHAQHYIDSDVMTSARSNAHYEGMYAKTLEWGKPRLDTLTIASLKKKSVYFGDGSSSGMEEYNVTVSFDKYVYRSGDLMRLVVKASAPIPENIRLGISCREISFQKNISATSNEEYVFDVPIPRSFPLDSIYKAFDLTVGASKPMGVNNPFSPYTGLGFLVFLLDKVEQNPSPVQSSKSGPTLQPQSEVKTQQLQPGGIILE
jgi:hypothetical protein